MHVVEQLTGVVHLGARGRIDFDEVDEAPLVDLHGTSRTPPQGRALTPTLAIEAFGQDTGHRRLADAAGAGEQVGVMQAVLIQSIDEGA